MGRFVFHVSGIDQHLYISAPCSDPSVFGRDEYPQDSTTRELCHKQAIAHNRDNNNKAYPTPGGQKADGPRKKDYLEIVSINS